MWLQPHISKIYEALGAIGDNRVEIDESQNSAKVFSSKKDKFYTVTWNDDLTAMMANDNSAFWNNKLSYPMLVVLMLKDKIKFNSELPELLKGVTWKELNTKFKNDFDKTVEFVLSELKTKGVDIEKLKTDMNTIQEQVNGLKVEQLGKKIRPPK